MTLIFLLFHHKNIYYGYSSEVSHCDPQKSATIKNRGMRNNQIFMLKSLPIKYVFCV